MLLAPYALRGTRRGRAIRTSVAIAALAASVTPTILDNAERSGSFTIAGSSWFNIWVGLNDSSRRNLRQPVGGREYRIFETSAATFAQRNQILRDKIVQRGREKGSGAAAGDSHHTQACHVHLRSGCQVVQGPYGVPHAPANHRLSQQQGRACGRLA